MQKNVFSANCDQLYYDLVNLTVLELNLAEYNLSNQTKLLEQNSDHY